MQGESECAGISGSWLGSDRGDIRGGRVQVFGNNRAGSARSARQNQGRTRDDVSARLPFPHFGLRYFCHADDLIELAFQFVIRLELAWINDRHQ